MLDHGIVVSRAPKRGLSDLPRRAWLRRRGRHWLLGTWGLVACLLAVGLSGCTPEVVEPPIPENIDALDPEVSNMFGNSLEAIADDPSRGLPWFQLAMGYQANEFFDFSQTCYEQALKLGIDVDPEQQDDTLQDVESKAWYQLAQVYQRNGNLDAAIDAMERAGELKDYTPIHWRRGQWLLERGRVDEAEGAFQAALDIASADLSARVGMARVAVERGELESAVQQLRDLLVGAPHDPEVHLLLGTALRQLGQIDEAQFHLIYGQGEPLVRMDEWSSELTLYRPAYNDKLRLASQYFAAGYLEIAEHMLEGLRQEKPEHLRTLTTLARTYRAAERPQEALETLETALEHHADNYTVLIEMSAVHRDLGQFDRALDLAEQCISAQPDKALGYARKAAVLMADGRFAEAARVYGQAVELDASDADVLKSLGDCFGKLDRWNDAEQAYARALEQQSRNPELYVRYGFAAYRNSSWDVAETALERALMLGPPRKDNVRQLLDEVRAARPQMLDEAIGS